MTNPVVLPAGAAFLSGRDGGRNWAAVGATMVMMDPASSAICARRQGPDTGAKLRLPVWQYLPPPRQTSPGRRGHLRPKESEARNHAQCRIAPLPSLP
jgi:hypothetical protein